MKTVDEANPRLSWNSQGMVLGLKHDVLSKSYQEKINARFAWSNFAGY